MSATVTLSSKGQISIPSAARKALNLAPGRRLWVDVRDGVLVIVPIDEDPIEQLSGLHAELWEDVDAQEYVDQERDAWEDS
jgi:AbrB family looped-hinge helix DNA binding protein